MYSGRFNNQVFAFCPKNLNFLLVGKFVNTGLPTNKVFFYLCKNIYEYQTQKSYKMNEHFLKVKNFLLDLEYRIVSEDTAEELVVIEKEEDGIYNLIIDCEDSIVVIEALLFELKKGSEDIFKSLLMMNRQLVHGAFALNEDGTKIIFRDTLQLENLDLNELEGSLNSLKLLLSEYSDQLIAFSKS